MRSTRNRKRTEPKPSQPDRLPQSRAAAAATIVAGAHDAHRSAEPLHEVATKLYRAHAARTARRALSSSRLVRAAFRRSLSQSHRKRTDHDRRPRKPSPQPPAPKEPKEPQERIVTTEHSVVIGGKKLDYTATCGTVVLREYGERDGEGDGKRQDDKPRATLFFTAYTRRACAIRSGAR